ncbi:MAG: ComEC/Rec2 family competence protein [Planctomycetota bacterium]
MTGERDRLDPSLRTAMSRTGTFHLLAISGLHVGILVLLVSRLPLLKRSRTWLVGFAVLSFSVLAGASPSILRATAMLGLGATLRRCGRRPSGVDVLSWTALVLLAVGPETCAEASFQMSFVAVAALLTYGRTLGATPRPRGLSRRRPGVLERAVRGARQIFIASLATSIATSPLTLAYFGSIYPLSPLWTVIALPLASVLVALCFLSVVVGSIALPLGIVFARPAEWVAGGLRSVVQFAADVPGSVVHLIAPPAWVVALFYAALLAGCWPPLRRTAWVAISCGILFALAWHLIPATTSNPTTLTHFDVRSGSCALLTTSDRRLLIDAGGAGRSSGWRLLKRLREAGVGRLDDVFLTHADADHTDAIDSVLRDLRVGRVWVPVGFERFGRGREILDLVSAAGIDVLRISRGDRLRLSELKVETLGPSNPPPAGLRENDASLSFRLTYGDSRVLFLGDLEEPGLARLLSVSSSLDTDVLVVPHHGRTNSLLPELLRASRPHTLVISGNGDGGARESAQRWTRTGFEVWATWKDGTVVNSLMSSSVSTHSYAPKN